jgi:crotonobetainyl-CoA:carnitine CoA-transferase CaiB-like acyl-CoA transferase
VLKFEAPQRLDGWRGGAGLTAESMYERNPFWNTMNRSKFGISLDLASAEGRRLFLRLVEDADVVVENFTARVMANLGLGYDVLRRANPSIIAASLAGFGQTGPWRDYSAFAFPTEEASGLAYLNGEPGGPPVLNGASVTDAMVAAMGAFAILGALERRARTGEGDYIDLSQIETLTTFIAGELVQAQVTGTDRPRLGNERPGLCPHGLFPCRPDGHLVAIAVRDDGEWRRLCEVLDRPDLAADTTLATATGRERAHQRVDEVVQAWTETMDGAAVVSALQAVGIPSAVAVGSTELAADDHLWVREFFRIIDREEVGAHAYPGPIVRLSQTPAVIERPPPLYGEHTAEILRTRLGLTDDDIAELRAAGVTSTEPLAQDWR